jgi:hypothetical protein
MSKMKQKEAVYQAVQQVVSEAGLTVSENTVYSSILTKEHRAQVNAILVQGFTAEEIELDLTKESNKNKMSDSAELKKYVSGLQKNWLDKDSRLNGGVMSVRTSSSVGARDPQLKAMRALLSNLPEGADPTKLEQQIADREAEITAQKAAKAAKKAPKIDVDHLPEHIRAKYVS